MGQRRLEAPEQLDVVLGRSKNPFCSSVAGGADDPGEVGLVVVVVIAKLECSLDPKGKSLEAVGEPGRVRDTRNQENGGFGW